VPELSLRSYQAEGLTFLREHPRAFLADEMGLGKSVQMLLASEGRTLIIAPAMVLDGGTWRDEVAKWAPERAGDITTVPFTSLALRDGRKITDKLKPEYRGVWDTIIVDEAHYIKGRKTSWTKLLKPLCKKAGRVILATGTPIPNWAQELFTTLCILYPEQAPPGGRLGSYWRWVEEWFDTGTEKIYVKGQEVEKPYISGLAACSNGCMDRPPTDPCKHYRDFFRANLGDRFLMRLRDDVLTDLPPLTIEQIETPMTAEQGRMYRQLKKERLAELADGRLKVAWNSGALHVMCDKLATGAEVLHPGEKSASGKLDRLAYDLAGRSRPTLVVAHFQAAVEAATAVARSVGAKAEFIHGGTSRPNRSRIVEEFKAGRLDVLVGSLETISEGLTLTAADMVIFLETSFKPSRNQQAMRRIHRMGQDRPCTVLDYLTPGTVDENKRVLLAEKTDHQIRHLSVAQMTELL
jgi:SNF2 family DNA or RNA helicase